jgi:hypothetical protein
MLFVIYDDTTGRIKRTGFAADMDGISDNVGTGEEGLAIDDGIYASEETHYVDIAVPELVEKDARPTPYADYYEYDYGTHAWVGNVTLLKAYMVTAVNTERDERVDADLFYDFWVDCSPTSIATLDAKIAEIEALVEEINPPGIYDTIYDDYLAFKGIDDVLNTYADTIAFLQWAGGLRYFYSQRRSQAYLWSYGKLDDLDALSTFAAVAAFDPTT